jgi:hypothetical protein
MQRAVHSLTYDEEYFIRSRIMRSSRNIRYYDLFRHICFSNIYKDFNCKKDDEGPKMIQNYELLNLYNKIKTPVEKVHMENSDIYENIVSFLINDPDFYPTYGKYLCVSKSFSSNVLRKIRESYLAENEIKFTIREFTTLYDEPIIIYDDFNYFFRKCHSFCDCRMRELKDPYRLIHDKDGTFGNYNIKCLSDKLQIVRDIKRWEDDNKQYYSLYQIKNVLVMDSEHPYFEIQG